MDTFQDTITGQIFTFKQDITLSEIASIFPELPATLSESVVFPPSQEYSWVNGQWEIDPVKRAAILKPAAQSELDKSDVTILRCVENAITVPAEWLSYRSALRAIISGQDLVSSVLPTKPAYPAGT